MSPEPQRNEGASVPIVAGLLVCGPVMAATLLMAGLVAAGQFGVGPLRRPALLSLAEAAAGGDALTAVRRIREGNDPNRSYPVAFPLAARGITALLPLEAGALTGDRDMVELLQREGAVLPPEDAHRVACVLASRGNTDIPRMLEGAAWDAARCAQ